MRRLPPLNAIRAFEAAARHVSFSRAAAELQVTHGAISRQVAALEAWLGLALFHRAPSHLTLTEAGRNYLLEVTAVLDRLALASLALADSAPPSVLRVSSPPTFAMKWLIPRLSVYQRRRPGLELRVLTSRAPVNFSDNAYDVALRGALEPPPGCVAVPLMTESILPICHVDLVDGLHSPEDLARHTLISYATEPYSWADWLHATGQPGQRAGATLRFEELFFALQAASEGLGIALVPLFLVIDDLIAGRLAAPFGSLGVRKRNYFACHQAEPPGSTVLAEFCAWLQAECRDTGQLMADWAKTQSVRLG